jgi:UDP-3-O-[3-hydroxymyristoyl] glucosamine N-acyltransferase
VILHPGVVIGGDGFGYARDGSRSEKIPQVGIVQIDDDVEIGANSTVDRAALGKTWIKRGVKIDNLVMVAHNVVIGENSLIVAQSGIAGSTELGNAVVLAAQAGLVGHIKVGDRATVTAQAGLTKDIPPKSIFSGSPAVPHRNWLKTSVVMNQLPDLQKDVKRLQKKVTELEQLLDETERSR